MTNLDSNGLLQDREIIRLKIQKNIQFLYYLAINSKVAKVEEQIIERVHNDNEILLKKPGVKDFSTNEKYNYSILPKVD